jgi:imidazolonepropionase-like amidohydrolase
VPALLSSQTRRPPLWFEGARLIVGDGTAPIESSAFLVEGDVFAWVGRKGERQPPAGATRVDLTGKTVIPALIDGHNHIGLVNEKDGSNTKANYTRDNLIDQLQRYVYYGTAAAMSMGLEANQDVAFALRDSVTPNAATFLTVGKGIAATPMAGPPGEARLGIPYGAATPEEGRQHVRELLARKVHFVKIWVDDRDATVPKLKPEVYRAIIDEAHKNRMEVLAHLSRTSALADAKDLLRAGIDGFVHTVRDRDVDDEYVALVKSHPRVWTGPNVPSPGETEDEIAALAETLPASTIAGLRKQLAQRTAAGNPPNALFDLHCRNLKRIHEAGMVIGLGTDGTGEGLGVHQQMEVLRPLRGLHAGRGAAGGHLDQRARARPRPDGNRCRRQGGQLRRADGQPAGAHHQQPADRHGVPAGRRCRSRGAAREVPAWQVGAGLQTCPPLRIPFQRSRRIRRESPPRRCRPSVRDAGRARRWCRRGRRHPQTRSSRQPCRDRTPRCSRTTPPAWAAPVPAGLRKSARCQPRRAASRRQRTRGRAPGAAIHLGPRCTCAWAC